MPRLGFARVQGMGVFFTSDLHFGHANIISFCNRPFSDPDHMNAALIANWNATVGPNDTVWILGDVAMGKIADTLPLVQRLNGHKRLVTGNHDRCWHGNGRKAAAWLDRYHEAGFELIVPQASIQAFPGVPLLLSHFPYSGDSHDEDRHTEHRPADDGGWLAHGHVHDTWTVNGRQINVGVDVWDYRPVPMAWIQDIIGGDG